MVKYEKQPWWEVIPDMPITVHSAQQGMLKAYKRFTAEDACVVELML